MNKSFSHATRLLARREHSARELEQKLKSKGYHPIEIKETLTKCQQLLLQDDRRFAENLYQSRIQQGYGPRRIQQELQAKGIPDELISHLLAQTIDWVSYATQVYEKKLKNIPWTENSTVKIKHKTQQFLLSRGFPFEIIRELLKNKL